MKSYRFSLYAYVVPAIFFIMWKMAVGTVSYGMGKLRRSNMFYNAPLILCMVCIIAVVLINMLLTVVYIDEYGITKRNLFGTKRLPWNDITRVSGEKSKIGEVVTFVIWGHDQKIRISRAMIRIVDIIDSIREHEVYMEGIPSSDTIFRQSERTKKVSFIFLMVYIVVMLFMRYQISESMREANDAQERVDRIRQQYNEILKEK